MAKHATAADDGEESSYDYRQLYRSTNGSGEKQIHTPRAIKIDRRGTLGSLNPYKNEGGGFQVDTWQGQKSTIRGAVEEKNEFLKMLERSALDGYSWEQPISSSRADQDEGADEEIFVQDSDVRVWSDFLTPTLHPSSVLELPFWPIAEPFDTFGAGMSRDIISLDDRELYFDLVRRFAEECDFLRNITLIADLFDGFGGLTCSLAQEIRDEMPRVTMPVWAITENIYGSSHGEANSINAQLQQCNIPLCYSSLLGDNLCTVLLPMCPGATVAAASSQFIDVDANRDYHTSAVMAAAIEVSTASSRFGQLEFNQWAADVTANFQRKLCGVEVSLPFPIDPRYESSSSAREVTVPSYREHMEPLWTAIGGAGSDIRGPSRCSPFMASLSSAVHGKWAAAEKVFATPRRQQRPLSNVIFAQGFRNTEFSSLMFDSARQSSAFAVSNIYLQGDMLPLPPTFPKIFRGVNVDGFVDYSKGKARDEEGDGDMTAVARALFPGPCSTGGRGDQHALRARDRERATGASRRRCSAAAAMTGLGIDDVVVDGHLSTVSSAWASRNGMCSAQLAKTGLGSDECSEITEKLHALSNH